MPILTPCADAGALATKAHATTAADANGNVLKLVLNLSSRCARSARSHECGAASAMRLHSFRDAGALIALSGLGKASYPTLRAVGQRKSWPRHSPASAPPAPCFLITRA